MAILFVQSKSAGSSTSPPSVTLDSTPTAGNLLVAEIMSQSTNTNHSISGWTPLANVSTGSGNTARSGRLFYKISDGTEGTITGGTQSNWTMAVAEYSGIDTRVPLIVQDSNATSSSTTHTTPTVNAEATPDMLVVFGGMARNNTTLSNEQVNSSTTGVNKREEVLGSTVCKLLLADKIITSASGDYNAQFTCGTSSVGIAAIALFRGDDGSTLVDSYSETNQDSAYTLDNGGVAFHGVGQSFTGNGGTIDSAVFFLRKSGAPTGNATVKLYAHSGTFGSSSIPTGSALATSATLNVATLPTAYRLVKLAFASPYATTNGTKYVLTVEFTGGNTTNSLQVGRDASSPTHGGNASDSTNLSSWSAQSGRDLVFYAFSAAKPSYTKTHTTDALKKKETTTTHSTDANKRKETQLFHSTDSLKRKADTKTHSTDSLKRKEFTASHTTDANKRKALESTHTTDALKRKETTQTHTTDSYLSIGLSTFEREHTTDSLKRTRTDLTHSTDTLKRKESSVAHTTDSNKKKGFEATHTTDSLKRKEFTATHTSDSLKKKGFETSHTSDALKRKESTLTHTTDSLKRKETTKQHTTDTLKRAAVQVNHTTDSNKRKGLEVSHTTDAYLLAAGVFDVSHSTDTLKKKVEESTHTTDTLKRNGFDSSHTTDSLKRAETTVNHTTDSLLRAEAETSHLTDSLKRTGDVVVHTTDALKRKGNTVTHTTDAFKRETIGVSHTTDSLLREGLELSHTTDANLRDGTEVPAPKKIILLDDGSLAIRVTDSFYLRL